MRPVVINGNIWKILRASSASLALVDRTGHLRLATTDPDTRTIYVSEHVAPPLLDMVILHEITHAITVSYGLLEPLRREVPEDLQVLVEEWSTELVEKFGLEAVNLASKALGRSICIRGLCV